MKHMGTIEINISSVLRWGGSSKESLSVACMYVCHDNGHNSLRTQLLSLLMDQVPVFLPMEPRLAPYGRPL